MNSSLFVATARPMLAVGRLLGDSFKMRKVACDWLKVGSRRSRDPLSGTRMPLCTSRTNRLAAGRWPASRSHSHDKHTIGQLLHTMHSPPCHNILSSCHAHSPPLLPSSAGGTWKPASLTASTWRRDMAQC